MIDLYTKGVLTVIAAALTTLALQNVTAPARAIGGDCGTYNPCDVRVVNSVDVGNTVTVDGTVQVFGTVETY